MTEHLSSWAIDRISLGHEPSVEVAAHVASCERCRADQERARAARTRFLSQVLPRTLPAIERQRRPRWLIRLGMVLAPLAVAGVLLVVWSRQHQPRDPLGGDRIKGTAALQMYAQQGEHVVAVRDGTRLAPGDRVRFVVEPAGMRYLLIASIDAAGAATVYVPYGGAQSMTLEAAPRVELPGSIVLDAALGPERVFALFSAEPLAADTVVQALAAIGGRGPSAIRGAHRLDVAAREQATVVFEKVGP
jgi:hypothetical protein